MAKASKPAEKLSNALISISLDLSAIPKDKIKVSDKNGRMYLNITVTGRKEPDQFGNDITVYVSQPKEEREAKADKQYIGAGKYFSFIEDNSPAAVEQMQEASQQHIDDLPF